MTRHVNEAWPVTWMRHDPSREWGMTRTNEAWPEQIYHVPMEHICNFSTPHPLNRNLQHILFKIFVWSRFMRINDSFIWVAWLISVRSCMCVIRRVHTSHVTHSYLRHDSFICVTRLIHASDTHSFVWQNSFMRETHVNFQKLAPNICVVLTSCVWTSHVISLNELCHTHERVMRETFKKLAPNVCAVLIPFCYGVASVSSID